MITWISLQRDLLPSPPLPITAQKQYMALYALLRGGVGENSLSTGERKGLCT